MNKEKFLQDVEKTSLLDVDNGNDNTTDLNDVDDLEDSKFDFVEKPRKKIRIKSILRFMTINVIIPAWIGVMIMMGVIVGLAGNKFIAALIVCILVQQVIFVIMINIIADLKERNTKFLEFIEKNVDFAEKNIDILENLKRLSSKLNGKVDRVEKLFKATQTISLN